MKQKNWIRWYGTHIAVCMGILAIAFGINQKININRSHRYAVTGPEYTILRDLTKVERERELFLFSGWGFDINYYNEDSRCELILQDTETGEALWPKMEKKPDKALVADRYTNGGDYSDAGFTGKLRAGKVKEDSVYEILLRYTSEYVDEDREKRQYIKTVTTDDFLYQGKVTEYNPKTFQAPEIDGSGLEKELEAAKLFHYFPEGLWIYYTARDLYYIVDKALLPEDGERSFPLLWSVRNLEDLPENRREYGFGNNGFYLYENEVLDYDITNYRIWRTQIPSEKIIDIHTGLYSSAESRWILGIRKQIGDMADE